MYTEVTSETELREIIEEPGHAIKNKATSVVDEESARFIAASPFFLLATTAADGSLDVSPRGDPPGSVRVINDGHGLIFGDREGNRRLDSFRNILSHPRIAMLFMVPGVNDTLRVNGRATLLRDGPFFQELTARGKKPQLAVKVHIDELFPHCGKAFVRSSLWQSETWPSPDTVPTAGRIFKSQHGAKTP